VKSPVKPFLKSARSAKILLLHIQANIRFSAQNHVPERQGGQMHKNIMMYQIMVDILKKWLKSGVISKKDYEKMNTKIAEKYGLSLSGIFVDNLSNSW
jgi:hypothetical protein